MSHNAVRRALAWHMQWILQESPTHSTAGYSMLAAMHVPKSMDIRDCPRDLANTITFTATVVTWRQHSDEDETGGWSRDRRKDRGAVAASLCYAPLRTACRLIMDIGG